MNEFLFFGAWALLGAIAFIATTFLVSSRQQWIVLSAVWIVVGTALLQWTYGVGHYWSVASFVGEFTVVIVLSIARSRRVGGRSDWDSAKSGHRVMAASAAGVLLIGAILFWDFRSRVPVHR